MEVVWNSTEQYELNAPGSLVSPPGEFWHGYRHCAALASFESSSSLITASRFLKSA